MRQLTDYFVENLTDFQQ